MKTAIVGDGLISPRVARLPACAGSQKRELILRCLWHGIDACPALTEHLQGGRCSGAEVIVGTCERDVKFGLLAARAEIGIHAAQGRRRAVAPTSVVDGVGRDIAGQVAGFAAGLNGRTDSAVGAAVHLPLDAVITES